jgi:hypothetical protein
VGINCNAPGYTFEVNGASRLNGNVNLPSFTAPSLLINSIIRTGSASPVQSFTQWGDGTGWQYNFLGNSARTSNVMTLDDRGRVGINCNAPAYNMDVNGTFAITSNTGGQFIVLRTNNFTTGGGSPAANISEIEMGSTYGPWIRATKVANSYADFVNLGFWTNQQNNCNTPVERMTVLGGGANLGTRVGIGCNAPASTLDVNGNTRSSNFMTKSGYAYSVAGTNTYLYLLQTDYDGVITFVVRDNNRTNATVGASWLLRQGAPMHTAWLYSGTPAIGLGGGYVYYFNNTGGDRELYWAAHVSCAT